MYFFSLCHLQKYKEFEKSVRVEEIDGMKVVKTLAKKMEEMFRMKKEAMRVCTVAYLFFYLPSTCSMRCFPEVGPM